MNQDNPLLESAPLPAFPRIRPEHVMPAIEVILADFRQATAAMLAPDAMPGRYLFWAASSPECRMRFAASTADAKNGAGHSVLPISSTTIPSSTNE